VVEVGDSRFEPCSPAIGLQQFVPPPPPSHTPTVSEHHVSALFEIRGRLSFAPAISLARRQPHSCLTHDLLFHRGLFLQAVQQRVLHVAHVRSLHCRSRVQVVRTI